MTHSKNPFVETEEELRKISNKEVQEIRAVRKHAKEALRRTHHKVNI